MALAALAMAGLAVRSAFVHAYAEHQPERAAMLWPGHPEVQLKLATARIGHEAVLGRPAPQEALADVRQAARKAPLAPEPYLVRGIQAQLAGDVDIAERAFLRARSLDPRSPAPRYFLADLYRATGQDAAALEEAATMARLAGAEAMVAPMLAQFATSAKTLPEVRTVLRAHPHLEPHVLMALAGDPANADLILRLASPASFRSNSGAPEWALRLMDTLIGRGEYSRAHGLWRRLAGSPRSDSIVFNPAFRDLKAPPPFNWSFASGSNGLAEPSGAAGLHVLFYGRSNAILATQTLLLKPGSYRLTVGVSGDPQRASAFAWRVACVSDNHPLLSLALGRSKPLPQLSGTFAVPADGCGAQRLELTGTAADFGEQADITITSLALSREGSL